MRAKSDVPEDWSELISMLEAQQAVGRGMGKPEKLAARAAKGLFNARERIDLLVDPGSFTELGSIVGLESKVTAPADALVCGMATVDGRPVIVGSEDATVMGGSIGAGSHAKRTRLGLLAGQEKVPLIMMLDGAGHRMTAHEPMGYAPNDMQIMARLSRTVPTITAVMGASAGHGAITALLSDIVVMAQTGAIFSAGPPLVAQALGEIITKEDLGGPTVHATSGVVHNIAPDERATLDTVRAFLSYLPDNAWQHPPRREGLPDTGERWNATMLDIVPRDGKKAYDMRDVVRQVADRNDFLEFQPAFGPAMLTGFCRIGGESVGVVANQPLVEAGSITARAAEKGAYFIGLCDSYHIPLLFLADNPGVMSGSQAEKAGTLRSAALMYSAMCLADVPKLQVTLRKAFGFGSSLMAQNAFNGQTVTYAFPGVVLGAMPAAGGDKALKADEAEAAFLREFEKKAWRMAANTLGFDEVIDPRDLRNKLLAALRTASGRRSVPPVPRVLP